MTSANDAWLETFGSLLCCPMCKGDLTKVESSSEMVCQCCLRRYPFADNVLNVLPDELRENEWVGTRDWTVWRRSQDAYEAEDRSDTWGPQAAREGKLAYDTLFRDFVVVPAANHAVCLDVGGAQGIVRHWLPSGWIYFSLDPFRSAAIPKAVWMIDLFPELAQPLPFLWGVGEYVPFRQGVLDVVFVMETLDHMASPLMAVREMYRVLKPGGIVICIQHGKPPKGSQNMEEKGSSLQTKIKKAAKLAIRGEFGHLARGIAEWSEILLKRGGKNQPRELDHHLWFFDKVDLERLFSNGHFTIVKSQKIGVHVNLIAQK